jgi:hypothetical protein
MRIRDFRLLRPWSLRYRWNARKLHRSPKLELRARCPDVAPPGRAGTPSSCAIDPTTGDLAVTSTHEHVAIYKAAKGAPKLFTDFSFHDILSYGYDDKGNLYVDGVNKPSG